MCRGIQYYQFEDINNLACGRAFAAIDYYNELSMKCTREYLTDYTAAIEGIISDPKKINIGKIALLNMQLKERLDMIVAPETIYKVASVTYFDETESPYGFDFKYSQKKVSLWKKEKVEDFFLRTHVKSLIPLTNLSDEDLQTYMKVGAEVDQEHLKTISTMLSNKAEKKG